SKSAQAEETMFEAGATQGPQNLRDDMGNTDEPPIVNVDPNDWFKKPEDLLLQILIGIKDRLTTFSKERAEVMSSLIIIWKNVTKH
nr:hypothetical protein [Tanacetum cinerariifolium]